MIPSKEWVRRGGPQLDSLGALFRLLGEKDGLDVGKDTTLGYGDAGEEFVELLVVPDGELEMPRDDPGLLVVPGGVAGQLENLSGQIFHDGGQVDGCTGSYPLGVVTLPQETVDPPDGELESGSRRAGLCLPLGFASFSSARHVGLVLSVGRSGRN